MLPKREQKPQRRPPTTAMSDAVDEYHGTHVTDPYRWMEDSSSAEFKTWLKSQADYTHSVLGRIPGRARIAARLKEILTAVPSVAMPVKRGECYFYLKLLPEADAQALYVREGVGGAERLLVDPGERRTVDTHSALDYFVPSWDGKYVAYGLSTGGSEDSVLYVVETATGRDCGERIDRAQYACPSWRPDSESFFYWRQGKQTPGALPHARYLNSKSYLHILGRDPEEDSVVIGRGLNLGVDLGESDLPMVMVTPGARHALGLIFHGTQNELTVLAAPLELVVGPQTPWKKIAGPDDRVVDAVLRGDDLYLLTHKNRSRYKVIRTSADKPNLARARTVVPGSESVLTNLVAAEDALYVRQTSGGFAGLLRLPYTRGARPERITLPYDGSISWLYGDTCEAGVLLVLASWTDAPLVFAYDPARARLVNTGLQPPHPLDMSVYTSVEAEAEAYDGTLVPLSIIHRRDLRTDGSAAAILEGYGAYGVSIEPDFLALYLPWLELGGVVAFAHARGGGELGKGWHMAGQKGAKTNTIFDGVACARQLIDHGYTSAKCLAVLGTSAGGIFAGGAITERPELFGAAVIRVGLTDCLRAEQTEGGPANVAEFGTTATPDGFEALLAASPYHRVKAATEYPAVLLTTGVNDPRVPAWQPAKLAARLQAATVSSKPVLLRVDYDAGHGLGSTRSQDIDEFADIISFLLWQFGVPDFHLPN